MADVTLSNGTEITFNFNMITVDEYEALFDISKQDAEKDGAIAKVCGISREELRARFGDYRLIVNTFIKRARDPLYDPNSPSASSMP